MASWTSVSALLWYLTLDVAPRAGLAANVNLRCLRAIVLTFRYRGIRSRSTFHGDDPARRLPAHNVVGRGLEWLLVAVEHRLRETGVLGDEKADEHGALGTSAE
jgi:hypothetical protein